MQCKCWASCVILIYDVFVCLFVSCRAVYWPRKDTILTLNHHKNYIFWHKNYIIVFVNHYSSIWLSNFRRKVLDFEKTQNFLRPFWEGSAYRKWRTSLVRWVTFLYCCCHCVLIFVLFFDGYHELMIISALWVFFKQIGLSRKEK